MPPDKIVCPGEVNRAALLAYMRRAGTVCVCDVTQRFCIDAAEAMALMGDMERDGVAVPCEDSRCRHSPAAWRARSLKETGAPT